MNESVEEKPLTTGEQELFDTELATTTKLNLRQELFCQLYATHAEFFGNGVQSYLEAYNPPRIGKWYDTACVRASQLLSNVKVFDRINEILAETGLNDVAVDKQLSFLIHQHGEFPSKLGAIREYNKLKKRITDMKEVKHSGTIDGFNFIRNDGDKTDNQTDS